LDGLRSKELSNANVTEEKNHAIIYKMAIEITSERNDSRALECCNLVRKYKGSIPPGCLIEI